MTKRLLILLVVIMALPLTNTEVRGMGSKLASYKALPAPKQFHQSTALIRWLFGGNRSGKSESNIGYDLVMYALGYHPHRTTPPNAQIWAVADEWDLVGTLLWKEKISQYLPPDQIKGEIIWVSRSREIPRLIELQNGTVIEFKAGSQGRKSFEGRALNAIYQDEQIKSDSEGIFIEMQARLEAEDAFFAGSMTPIHPQPWLEERVAEGYPTDAVFYANLNDNRKSRGGYVSDRRIDILIAQWALEVQETRIKGHFASFLGAVYKTFTRLTHVCAPFEIPADWPRYRGIDWGFNNPFACLWMALSPDRIWYIYAEHYSAQQTLAYHAERIKKISGKDRYRVTWADHEAQERHEFKTLGIKTMPAKKDIHLGIEAVQAALKVQDNGKPRVQIMNTCPRTIREMAGLRWPEGTDTKDPKDIPLQKDDHCPDIVRYIIYGVEHKGYFAGLVG